MNPIVCDRCFREGHVNTNCVEVYDIEGNEIQNLETPKPTNFQDEYIFPYDDDDDYDKYSEDRWSQKEWTERIDDDFDEQERLFHLQTQQDELEFQHEDHTDLYNGYCDNLSKASTKEDYGFM